MTIRLTTRHSASSRGIPVILDAKGQPMDYVTGLRAIRRERGWSVADLAARCGVSARTVEGYEQGRYPRVTALLSLAEALASDPTGDPTEKSENQH